MMNKRLGKLDLALKEISNEDKAVMYGEDDSTDGLTLLSWGSTKGVYPGRIRSITGRRKENKVYSDPIDAPVPCGVVGADVGKY